MTTTTVRSSQEILPGLYEETYFSGEYTDREDLEAACSFWDATSSSTIARCPRYGQHFLKDRIVPKGEAVYLRVGQVVHEAIAVYYATGRNGKLAIDALVHAWGDPKFVDERWPHLHLGALEIIFQNYIRYSLKHDTFEPIRVHRDQLRLDNVLGAVWFVDEEGFVVLGESKFVMQFEVDGEPFVYAGKPDLPITLGGHNHIMDHKTTSGYLSSYYFSKFKHSNQLRGYAAMIQELIGQRVDGALINGIYVGEKATATDTKATKFDRYGPMLYREDHLQEALRNQKHWQETYSYYNSRDYFPQNTGQSCVNCMYDPLCTAQPRMRASEIMMKYENNERHFLDL